MKRCSAFLVSSLIVVNGARMPGQASALPARPYTPLSHNSRTALMAAQLAGDVVATIRVATQRGAVPAVVQAIEAAGGVVRFRDDRLAYLRARIPLAGIMGIAARSDIEGISVSSGSRVAFGGDHGEASVEIATRDIGSLGGASRAGQDPHIPGPSAATPAANPYLPILDIGVTQFIAAHPTYDGRGVTIGTVESVGDPSEPTLQEAKDLKGRPVRKLSISVPDADLPGTVRGVAGADSIRPDSPEIRARVRVRDSVVARNGRFSYEGATYRAPRDGEFLIAQHANLGLWWYDRPGPFMLWSVNTGEVWLDTHNVRDFTTAPPIHDFNASGEYGFLGSDDPRTWWDDRPVVAVILHPKERLIDCFMPGYIHTTAVSAVAAGTRLYGGAAHGVAPNARIVWYAGNNAAIEEAFIGAARIPEVDVLTNHLIIDARLRDDHTVFSLISRRLVDETKKLMFISTDNKPPFVNGNAVLASADGALGMTGYVSRESFWYQYGLRAPKIGAIHVRAGAAGPTSDGAFAPFALAPSSHVPPWAPFAQWGADSALVRTRSVNRALYPLPVRYIQASGTSFTAPSAAGVAALLISAARQANLPHDAARLKIALAEGAVPVPDEPAYRQGNGRLNVERSWVVLQRMAREPDPVAITTLAPVRTVVSHELFVPHMGRGLFEREGWSVGDTGTRLVRVTRTSGPNAEQRFTARWRMNDGTFSSARAVALRLNEAVEFPLRVAPRTPGAHSAILEMVDANGHAVHQMMATIVAAEPLVRNTAGTLRGTFPLSAQFLEQATRFIRIPAGVDSMTVTVTLPTEKSIRFGVNGPSGLSYQSGTLQHGDPLERYAKKTTHSITLVHPERGAWELGFINSDDSLRFDRWQPVVSGTMTVTAYPQPSSLSGTTVRLTFQPGDSARSIPLALDFTTRVVHAYLTRPSMADADLDLYLARCTGATSTRCIIGGASTIGGAQKAIAVERVNQQTGSWRVIVDPVRVPQGGVTVDLVLTSGMPGKPGVAFMEQDER